MRWCELALVAAAMAPISNMGFAAPSDIHLRRFKYYTCAINQNDINIPDGSIITDARLTLYALTSLSDNPAPILRVYLLDNPPLSFHENLSLPNRDHLAPHGCPMKPDYLDRIPGHETLVYRLGAIDNADSWAWRIYPRPLSVRLSDARMVPFSSSLLELIDYAGNSTPLGIGLSPVNGDFTLRGMSLTLTIEAYEGLPYRNQLGFSFGDTKSPPIIQGSSLRVAAEDVPLKILFSASNPDGDVAQLTCNALPPGAAFENGVFSWIPPYDTTTRGVAARIDVTFTASTGTLWTGRTCTIWVFDTNRPPEIGDLTLLSTDKAKLVFSVNATDPDGDPLTYRTTQMPPMAAFDASTRRITWDTTELESGTYPIALEVSDGLLTAQRIFQIEIRSTERIILIDRQSGATSR